MPQTNKNRLVTKINTFKTALERWLTKKHQEFVPTPILQLYWQNLSGDPILEV